MESRAANQTKHEPMPASATESETETPASHHPQAPTGGARRHCGDGGDVGDAAGVPPTSDQPAAGTSEELPVVQGVHTPAVTEPPSRR